MMIKCPRCGFSQPKDKYCAQCGLDIENFQPPEVPLFKKIFGDPFLQLSAVILIAIGSGFYVYKHNRQEIQDRVSFFRQGIQYNNNMNSSLPPAASSTEGQARSESSEMPAPLTTSDEEAPPKRPEPPPPPPPVVAAEAAKAADNKAGDSSKTQIQVRYVEVSEAVREQISLESRSSGQFNSLGDHEAGIWPQGKKKIPNLRSGFQTLVNESKPYEAGRTLQYFVGLRGNDPENDLGLTTYIEVSGIDAQGLHGHLEIVRAWRETGAESPNTIQRRFYPAPVELTADSVFFIYGVLPRGSAMESDPYLTNIDPFKILKTNSFKNRLSEFLIVVDFDKSNP